MMNKYNTVLQSVFSLEHWIVKHYVTIPFEWIKFRISSFPTITRKVSINPCTLVKIKAIFHEVAGLKSKVFSYVWAKIFYFFSFTLHSLIKSTRFIIEWMNHKSIWFVQIRHAFGLIFICTFWSIHLYFLIICDFDCQLII